MLIIKEQMNFGVGFGHGCGGMQTKIICENCLQTINAWTYHTRTCPMCKTPIPNIIEMKAFAEDRINYHFEFMQKG